MDNITGLIHTEEAEEAAALQFLEALRLKSADRYECPRFTLYQNGVGFAPLGNIMAVCAEKKSGKSWLLLQLAVAMLRDNGSFGCLKCGEDIAKSVLWIDTEQDKYDTMLILRRVQYLCGWDFGFDNDKFRIFNLRSMKHDERCDVLRKAIQTYRPSVVMVDGVRDLVADFNDQAESFNIIEEEMRLSEEFNCAIWNVLHVNPNSDKMRGHLGTELGNKATDVFSVKKQKENGAIWFKVEQVSARHRDVDGWSFAIDDDAQYSVPKMSEEISVPLDMQTHEDELREKLAEVMGIRAMSKTRIKEEIKSHFQIGSNNAHKMITTALDKGILEVTIDNKLRLVGNPVNTDDDVQTEAPF